MEEAIFDPTIPYIGPIHTGQFKPGKVIKIQALIPDTAYRFTIGLQCGPESVPRDDVAMQMTVRLLDGYVSFNSLINGSWGEQQRAATFSVTRGEEFEIAFICDYNQYKVLLDDQDYCIFPKRITHGRITHLAIEGDIAVAQISYESIIIHDVEKTRISDPSGEHELDVVKLIEAAPHPEVQPSRNDTAIEKKLEAAGIPEYATAEAVPLNPKAEDKLPNLDKYETVDRYYWHKFCALFWGVILCIIIIFAIVLSLAEKHPILTKGFNITGNATDANNTISLNDNETIANNNDTILTN